MSRRTISRDVSDREARTAFFLVAAIFAVMAAVMTLATRWAFNSRVGVMAKAMVLVLLVGLSSGCHTISSTALAELDTAAAQSQANVNDPTVATSDRAKHALWAQGRVYADVLQDTRGDPIPAFYAVDPWAPVVAPVTTK